MHNRRILRMALAAVLALTLGSALVVGQEIVGTLSNFDVHNIDRRAYNDFELHILGEITPDCILGWYHGWGAPPDITDGSPFGEGITVKWKNYDDPIHYCRTEHFGLHVDPECKGRFAVLGFWSINCERVRPVPIPWQFWRALGEEIEDIIVLPEQFEEGPVFLQRWVLVLDETIPLDELNWDLTDRLFRCNWELVDEEPLLLEPGEEAVLPIPVIPGQTAAVLVRYEVIWNGQVVTRFTNEAILEW